MLQLFAVAAIIIRFVPTATNAIIFVSMAELDFDGPNFPHPSPLGSCHFLALGLTCLSFWHLSRVV